MAPDTPAEAPEIPEHTVIMLLEGAQRFLAKAEDAIRNQDAMLRDFFLKRVLAILLELTKRVDCEQGGELVNNLIKVYDWWGREVLEAGEQDDAARLKVVSSQMGEIRKSWEQVLFKGQGMSEYPEV
jgi:flagellar protein FliS